MKARSWILGAAATVTGLVAAQAQVTIGYNFGVGSGSLTSSSGTPVNFSIGAYSVANTVGTLTTNPNSASPSTGYAGSSGNFNYDNAAPTGAFNNGTSGYFSVTVTPSPGYRLTISDFDFGALSVTGATGPVSYALRTSIDSFAADLFTPGSFTANSTWALKNNTFTSVTGAFGTPVTLRLYTYGNASVTSGTANILLDDVALTVAAVPEASDCALYGCAAIVGFTWWRRSKKSVKQA